MIASNINIKDSPSTITFRPGTDADSYAIFLLFESALADLLQRFGSTTPTSIEDPAALAEMWQERQMLYKHLAHTAAQFWVAEQNEQIVGFARSILRDGHLELTELFVSPNQQSGGIGRQLINRAFPKEQAQSWSIISTADMRAQALYIKLGVVPRFLVYYFGKTPKTSTISTDLIFEPITDTPEILATLAELDQAVLGHQRNADHTWYQADRQGYLYVRNGQPVGYGYLGYKNGPFALLNSADYPAVLAHAENIAALEGRQEFGIEVPIVNQAAVEYLLARGFKLDTFLAVFMSNVPFGKFENYIFTSPPFFL